MLAPEQNTRFLALVDDDDRDLAGARTGCAAAIVQLDVDAEIVAS